MRTETIEKCKQALKLVEAGKSQAEACKKFGIGTSTLHNYLSKQSKSSEAIAATESPVKPSGKTYKFAQLTQQGESVPAILNERDSILGIKKYYEERLQDLESKNLGLKRLLQDFIERTY